LKMSKLISKYNRLNRLRIKKLNLVLLLYITNDNFKKIKRYIKNEVRNLKHSHILPVLKKVNSILRGIAAYYSFGLNTHRLDYLNHYVDRLFWRALVDKFRYKGIRRSKWVAHQFFICKDKDSPYGLKWHLHAPLVKEGAWTYKRNVKSVWCVHVLKLYNILPITKMMLSKKLRNQNYYMVKEEIELLGRVGYEINTETS
jgi:hypothetical protein